MPWLREHWQIVTTILGWAFVAGGAWVRLAAVEDATDRNTEAVNGLSMDRASRVAYVEGRLDLLERMVIHSGAGSGVRGSRPLADVADHESVGGSDEPPVRAYPWE